MRDAMMINTNYVNRIEYDISPPMSLVVTVPLKAEIDGVKREAIIYICTSPFSEPATEKEFKAIVEAVVSQLRK